MKLRSYLEYLKEASLQGNSGVPPAYLANVERGAQQMTDRFKRERGQDLGNFMRYVSQAHRLQRGHEEELEVIAEECIRLFYGSILDGVTLNIKFPKGREVEEMMEEPEMDTPDRFQAIEDADTIKEIEKRKVLKNITQGEAKNSKLMLNLPEVRDRIYGELGEENGRQYLELLNKITDIASFFDWEIPMEVQKEMWERDKSGFAGSVDVSWEKNEEEPESHEEIADRILNSLKETPDIPDETEDMFNKTTPTITAYGKDFAMLIHEAIKGIYQLIISLSIPENPELAEKVLMNTDTLADELEDLRYGPKFAADLRDFINTFPEIDSIDNLREHVVGKLSLLPPDEFLQFMVLFLNGDPRARTKMGVIINSIKKELSDYAIDSQEDPEEHYIPGTEEHDDDDTLDEPIPTEASNDGGAEITDDELRSMPDSEIIKLMDIAIDNEDEGEYNRLAKFLKESRNYEFD